MEVGLQHPHPEHGMSTNEEFQTLSEIEDFIGANETQKFRYIARQTGNAKRKFYFQASPDCDFDQFTARFSENYPSYEKSNFSFEDPAWQTYFQDLYPNAIGLNEISNRAVCDQLEANGDDLSIARTIDHNVYFSNKHKAQAFETAVAQKGFSVETTTKGMMRKTYSLLVQRTDAPGNLDLVTFELKTLAEELGGEYDGWGCFVAVQT